MDMNFLLLTLVSLIFFSQNFQKTLGTYGRDHVKVANILSESDFMGRSEFELGTPESSVCVILYLATVASHLCANKERHIPLVYIISTSVHYYP